MYSVRCLLLYGICYEEKWCHQNITSIYCLALARPHKPLHINNNINKANQLNLHQFLFKKYTHLYRKLHRATLFLSALSLSTTSVTHLRLFQANSSKSTLVFLSTQLFATYWASFGIIVVHTFLWRSIMSRLIEISQQQLFRLIIL